MAEGKKGILVYADWMNKFEELTDDEAGKLIKHFFRYVNDLNPEAPDRITKLMFVDIKNTLKRDLNKYQNKKEERSYNGRLGNLKKHNEDLYNDVVSQKITIEDAESTAKHRKTPLSDKSTAKTAVSDSVNENDKDSVNEKENNINNNSLFEIEVNESTEDEFRPKLKNDLVDTLKNENINNSRFTKECKVYTSWSESVAMTNKISVDVLNIFLDTFDAHLINYGEQKRSLKDYKSHFNNWLSKQNLSQFRVIPVGKSNQVNYGN